MAWQTKSVMSEGGRKNDASFCTARICCAPARAALPRLPRIVNISDGSMAATTSGGSQRGGIVDKRGRAE
jgi:hypothetical protein